MSFKTTSFLSPHYPNTYMEQFYKALHPDLELGTVCVAWFRQAIKHCTDLLNDATTQTTYFWTTVKNFIFPDRTTELISQKIPININPKRLSQQDCQALFLDLVSDYVQRAPRYAAESVTNVMLWQILYSVMGIMALGSMLVGIICIYNKYGQTKQELKMLDDVFSPENRMLATAKRTLRLAKAEIRNIHMRPAAKVEDILPADGAEVLAIKVGRKHEFLESVVLGNMYSQGKLHRLYDQHNKTKTDFKIEPLKKAMKFLDNNCNKLHVLLMFEEDATYDEEMGVNSKRKSNSPRIKSLSPLNSNRLDVGDFKQKAGIENISGSPRKLATTPRSSGVANSSIPRNVSKRSPINRNSK
ncbi:uncharacterized protein LOC135960806 [Calliphora vicina]|uniref:uncharacterized protein LOC135960806 n=1 Tax=Calliphora vicina TaxID=7373 RepID=UPI00325AEDAE